MTRGIVNPMENITDICNCNPCPSRKRGEFDNAKDIATPIIDNYLGVEHVNHALAT